MAVTVLDGIERVVGYPYFGCSTVLYYICIEVIRMKGACMVTLVGSDAHNHSSDSNSGHMILLKDECRSKFSYCISLCCWQLGMTPEEQI